MDIMLINVISKCQCKNIVKAKINKLYYGVLYLLHYIHQVRSKCVGICMYIYKESIGKYDL